MNVSPSHGRTITSPAHHHTQTVRQSQRKIVVVAVVAPIHAHDGVIEVLLGAVFAVGIHFIKLSGLRQVRRIVEART